MKKSLVIRWPQNGYICKYYNICLPFNSDMNHVYDYTAFIVLQDKLKRLNIIDENYIQYNFFTHGEISVTSIKIIFMEGQVLIDNILELIRIIHKKETLFTGNEDIYVQSARIFRKKQGINIDFVNQIDSYLTNIKGNGRVKNDINYNDYIQSNSFDMLYISLIDNNNYFIKNENNNKLKLKNSNSYLINNNEIKEIVLKSPHLYSVYVMISTFKYELNDFFKWKLIESLLSVLIFEYIRNYAGITYTTECSIDMKRELIYIKAYIERNYIDKFSKYVTIICNNIVKYDFGKEKINGLKLCLKEMVLKMFDNPKELISFLTENNMYDYLDDINKFDILISSITWDEIKYLISKIKFNLRFFW